MFFFVTLSLCVASSFAAPTIGYAATPVVTPSGHLADTPEVAAAKAAHFAEHAKRGNYHLNFQHATSSQYVHPYSSAYNALAAPSYYLPVQQHYKYEDAPANIVVKPDGFLADTPEVAAAKAAHLAEKAKVPAYHYGDSPSYVPHAPYYGSVSHAVVPFNAPVADTPEVAHAKAAHLAEHAAVEARNAHAAVSASHEDDIESNGLYDYSHQYQYVPVAAHPISSYYAAAPVVTPSGHLADTPEVAHAKAAHLAEYAAIAHRHKRSLQYPLLAAHGVAPSYITSEPLVAAYSLPILSHGLVKSHQQSTVVHGPHAVSSSHQTALH